MEYMGLNWSFTVSKETASETLDMAKLKKKIQLKTRVNFRKKGFYSDNPTFLTALRIQWEDTCEMTRFSRLQGVAESFKRLLGNLRASSLRTTLWVARTQQGARSLEIQR